MTTIRRKYPKSIVTSRFRAEEVMISLLVVMGLIKTLTRTPILKVIRHPIAFHQNQKIPGTYNHKIMFRPTPQKRPILAPIA